MSVERLRPAVRRFSEGGAQVGFARYFLDGWLIDREIVEVWDGSAQRWRLVEPEIDDGHTDPVDRASFDALDVPPNRFLTARRAWQLARSGAVDPERFVVLQPSPPLADLRSAYRRPEFVVPDTVTTYSPARTDVPAVVDVSSGGPGSQLTGALVKLAAARPGGIARSGVAAVPSGPRPHAGHRSARNIRKMLHRDQ